MRAATPPAAVVLIVLSPCLGCGRDDASPGPDAGVDGSDDAAAALADPSPGCLQPGAAYGPGVMSSDGLVWAGQDRRFLIHLPAGYDHRQPVALVLMFHGGLGTGMQMASSSQMSPIADREGFAVAYPDGTSRSWNAGRCCGPPAEQNVDDVGFVRAMIDRLAARACLDQRRIYASGMSNGGMFSHRLACDLGDRVAAIAPVAGTNMTTSCTPGRPVPVLHVHGSQDRHVPWEGGAGCGIAGVPYTSVPDTLAGWRQRNGCTEAPATLVVEQGDGRCESQGSCPAGADVVLCTIAGGGHSWPGGPMAGVGLPACERAGDGTHSRTFLASEQIWSFFRQHRR